MSAAAVEFTDNWTGHVLNVDELLRAVLSGRAPRQFVIANQRQIDRFARLNAGKVTVPGIEWRIGRIAKVLPGERQST